MPGQRARIAKRTQGPSAAGRGCFGPRNSAVGAKAGDDQDESSLGDADHRYLALLGGGSVHRAPRSIGVTSSTFCAGGIARHRPPRPSISRGTGHEPSELRSTPRGCMSRGSCRQSRSSSGSGWARIFLGSLRERTLHRGSTTRSSGHRDPGPTERICQSPTGSETVSARSQARAWSDGLEPPGSTPKIVLPESIAIGLPGAMRSPACRSLLQTEAIVTSPTPAPRRAISRRRP
jgi:hypothetical protein